MGRIETIWFQMIKFFLFNEVASLVTVGLTFIAVSLNVSCSELDNTSCVQIFRRQVKNWSCGTISVNSPWTCCLSHPS